MSSRSAEQIPVKINVKTVIRKLGSKETFELTAFGRYYIKDSARFLQYDEVMEEGTVKTIIKMSDTDGLILRSGAVKMRLPFRMNKKLRGSYETPYGVFEMGTVTKRMVHQYDDKSSEGSIDILYDLKMQGSQAGTYHLAITFEEENNEHS
ncbi:MULTISPECIES: DUF1934 domain-containing protein [unclassified Cytobacillus]|uniref:DUF1934 domain-containing protein n=1 Tax=unclassified Cytobacillus TaxID=2675268 RepID=UPI0020401C68|nr:DUF1934 domain-containing protein [Cytobacillus sp. AMY 15.2]MCM3093943.1 DUF1934 domain-containing protein [Cytobacillus sp. AMY 15.2]